METITITQNDADRAKECVQFLAGLANRLVEKSKKYGDEVEVANNLRDVLSVLNGERLP